MISQLVHSYSKLKGTDESSFEPVGITDNDYQKIVHALGHELPAVHKVFFKLFGDSENETLLENVGIVQFPEILDYKENIRAISKYIVNKAVAQDIVVFRNLDNEDFWFYYLDGKEDPVVYFEGYSQGNGVGKNLSNYLIDLLEGMVAAKIHRRRHEPEQYILRYLREKDRDEMKLQRSVEAISEDFDYFVANGSKNLGWCVFDAFINLSEKSTASPSLYNFLMRIDLDEKIVLGLLKGGVSNHKWTAKFLENYKSGRLKSLVDSTFNPE